eukprot:2440649-Pyramimonas_sp.AAC.1
MKNSFTPGISAKSPFCAGTAMVSALPKRQFRSLATTASASRGWRRKAAAASSDLQLRTRSPRMRSPRSRRSARPAASVEPPTRATISAAAPSTACARPPSAGRASCVASSAVAAARAVGVSCGPAETAEPAAWSRSMSSAAASTDGAEATETPWRTVKTPRPPRPMAALARRA